MFIRGIVFEVKDMGSYRFFQNKECEYFPCHKCSDEKDFNCLFCYCPLYVLGDQCGGAFTYTEQGIKDCSACMKPHLAESYDTIMEKMGAVMDLLKKENV